MSETPAWSHPKIVLNQLVGPLNAANGRTHYNGDVVKTEIRKTSDTPETDAAMRGGLIYRNASGNQQDWIVDADFARHLERQRAELADALRIEQELALRGDPFRCSEVECCNFNRPVRSGGCLCYADHAQKHRANVRSLLARLGGEGGEG